VVPVDSVTDDAPREFVLHRIAAGDPGAVRECMSAYSDLVWSIARRLCASVTDAEDAVQEAFIEVWKSAARFDPSKASEKAFVATIARRRIIDALRRTGRRMRAEPLTEDVDARVDEHLDIEDRADVALAERAIEPLRPDQRRVLLLSVYHGMSHAEIVEETGLPLGTVKSHVRRSLIEVRERLEAARKKTSG
jgi:RNA polymerase sigma-70 factor (ECF subfamily)